MTGEGPADRAEDALGAASEEAIRWSSRTATPPDFCRWRALLGVAVVSLLSTALVLLGHLQAPDPPAILPALLFGLALGAFCAACVCLSRVLLERLSIRAAWLLAWAVVVLAAWLFSYGVGIVSTVLGFGPGQDRFDAFVMQSVIGVAIVSVALFRYLFIRSQWQSKMLSEAEARVHALQSRIRPHFLFNSLNMIANLIEEDPAAAEHATMDLAEMFRAGMRRADRLVPLSEELAIARRYLDMEQRRLGDRLQLKWALDSLPDVPVLPMVLQPLLENAVSHGIAPRPGGGTVQVSGRFDGSEVVITVTNPLAPDGTRRGSGMALHNIRSRLALAYGDRARLLTERDGERYYAVLTLPGKASA